jgi:SPP1 family predicted phage head-tail adaptor
MDAGQFDRRLRLQRATKADDGYTSEPTGYTNLATVWAKHIPLSGAERLEAGEVGAVRKVRYKIRRDSSWSDLNETDRFLEGSSARYPDGIPHNIVSVISEGRGFYLIDAVYRGDQA